VPLAVSASNVVSVVWTVLYAVLTLQQFGDLAAWTTDVVLIAIALQLPDRDALHEVAPAQLGPLFHAQHVLPPDAGVDVVVRQAATGGAREGREGG